MISNGKGTHTHTTTKLNTSKQQFSRLSERSSINLDQPTSVPVYCATILWEFEPILDIYKNLDSRMSVNEVYNFTIWSAGGFPRPGWRLDRSLPWLQLHLSGWARLLVNPSTLQLHYNVVNSCWQHRQHQQNTLSVTTNQPRRIGVCQLIRFIIRFCRLSKRRKKKEQEEEKKTELLVSHI